MRVRAFSLLLVIFLFISLTGAGLGQAQAVDPALDAQTQPEADSNNSSVMFIENVGQFDLPAGSGQASGARFLVHGGDRAIWLAQEAIWVTVMEEPSPPHSPDPAMWEEEMLSPHGAGESENPPRTGVNIKLSFPGANPNPRLEPFNRLETSVNYFLGNDPAGWRSEVPVWGGVRYKDLYPGIDLEVSGESGQVVQRLVVRAGADLSAVRLRVEGADDVELFSSIGGGKGLHLTTAVGEFSLPLIAFNDLDTVLSMKKTTRIEKHNSQVFDIAWPFDQIAPGSNQSLSVSAPQDNPGDLLYATFLGGSSYDYGVHITVDASGAAYVTGSTISNNFPTTPGAVDTSLNGSYDGFVVKLNETGSSITYATYLGGSNDDGASRIAIDASGAAFVTGSTYSNNFPTTPGAVDTSHNGSDDAFVVKLNGAGSAVIYATYLGGNSTEGGGGIAVDASGAAYVTGSTASTNFPTTPGAMDTSYNGGSYDVFMTKLNGSGSALVYATYLGGSNNELARGISLDPSGAAYITGDTGSPNFPTTPGAMDTSYNGGSYDVFMTKLNGSGSALVYATYLGGSNEELGFSFDVDASGAAYIVGRTSSLNFPITPGALDTNHNGNNDAFVVKLNGVGSALIYATYLGGSSNEGAVGVTVDASGAAFVSGSTDSTNFPTTPGAMDTSHNGNVDGFIAKLNEAGSALAYATYLGGSGDDYAGRIAIDSSGAAYVTGETASTNFPTTPGAVDTSHNGNTDAFIAKLEMKNSTTELAEKIQSLANNTNTRLNQLLAEADHIAQDGDYFAVQKKEDEVDLITDAILDSASILGDGFEAVNKVKDLTKIQFPGVVGRGWGYVLNLKADHEVARDAFLDALQREVTSANAQRAAREFFNGAHIYYAADMVDAAAEDLLGNEIKDALKLGLNSDLALQNQLYPAQQELVTLFQQDVASTRDRVIAQLPPLSPAQAQAYIDDLNYRDMANYVMLTTLERRAVPLHQAQDDRENHQDNWIANFLAKYLIKGLAYLYADGPGVLAVDIGSAYWNLYQNSRKLAQDRQMMNLAVNGMAGTLSEESRMYLNTVHGIDNITQGIQPQIANADVSWIASSSEGEYKLFGRWWWCEHSSYNDINLSNNTSYDTVYQVISSYGATGFLGTSYQSLVSEGVKAIPASGANTIRVYYKQGDEGVSPDEDSTIIMDVLGSTNTGTYYVDTKNLTWAPTRIPLSAAFQISTQDQADAPAVPYPIHTQLAVDENNLLYTPHIWVTNAFTQTALVTLTQTLPANVQVIDANGGSLIGNSLRWQTTLDPQASVEITHSVRYLGSAGQTVQYPEPQLEMTDTGFIESVTFNGEAETFISQLPLGAEGAPPAAVERGESVTIPITVTNRLNDQTTAGTVRLILIDLDTQTEVYSQSIDVSILAGATQTVDLFLDAAYVTGFNYLLIVTVESNEGQDEVFSEYLNVQQNFYLPLIRLND